MERKAGKAEGGESSMKNEVREPGSHGEVK